MLEWGQLITWEFWVQVKGRWFWVYWHFWYRWWFFTDGTEDWVLSWSSVWLVFLDTLETIEFTMIFVEVISLSWRYFSAVGYTFTWVIWTLVVFTGKLTFFRHWLNTLSDLLYFWMTILIFFALLHVSGFTAPCTFSAEAVICGILGVFFVGGRDQAVIFVFHTSATVIISSWPICWSTVSFYLDLCRWRIFIDPATS